MAYCSALSLNFFLYYMYHRSIHLPFSLCIKDTDFDTLPKQGHTNRYMYVCLLINFWKQCCGFIVIINRFLLQMVHFLSHIELKWKYGLRVYFFYTCISGPTPQISNGENWPENSKQKKRQNSIIKMSSFPLYDSMHGQYVNSRDGFATIDFFLKGKNTIYYPDQNHVESQWY